MNEKTVLTQHRKAREGSFFSELETLYLQEALLAVNWQEGMWTPRFGAPTAGSNLDSAYQVSKH